MNSVSLAHRLNKQTGIRVGRIIPGNLPRFLQFVSLGIAGERLHCEEVMFLDTDPAVRDVFTDLHARSIVACGGLKESIQELKRDVMLTVYEVKDRREVTDEVLADLLGISDRWLRMLGDTKPAPKPVSDGRRLLLLLQQTEDWTTTKGIMNALREVGEYASPKRTIRLLNGLVELGQVESRGRGDDREFRAVEKVVTHVADKKQRSKEAKARLTSLLGTVYGYVNNVRGSLCSRYQYRVRKDRLAVVSERIRHAVSEILQEEEALCAGQDFSKSEEYTVLVNAAMGLSGRGAFTEEGEGHHGE